ncbi:MAG TPA: glutamate racemase [Peptococcaceae bacterium]|nr:glutamate racemase [Peptococcaceae bacterium]
MIRRPIGIFDSGVGGLTVARFIFSYLPERPVVYFGDTAHVPYGSRSRRELIVFGERIISFLLKLGAEVIVAACNTSSSVSLPVLKKRFSVPIIGMIEPGVRAALKATREKRIGVIATEATVNSGSFRRAFEAFDPEVQVYQQACPLFVPLVESGKVDTEEARQAAFAYLKPLQEVGIDTLVLGCTHYPFLTPVLQEVLGPEVRIVDPAEEVVRELVKALGNGCGEHQGDCPERQEHRFFASGPTTSFYTLGKRLFGEFPFTVEQVNLDHSEGESTISWIMLPGNSQPGLEGGN